MRGPGRGRRGGGEGEQRWASNGGGKEGTAVFGVEEGGGVEGRGHT